MDAETLAALKAHCHIDHDDDDKQLIFLYHAAVAYLDGVDTEGELYQFALFSIVAEWYDGAPIGTVTLGLRQVINQLKLHAPATTGDGL